MKIQIDASGNLSIERAGKFKEQDCPHGAELGVWCGDWCPMFGEPDWKIDPGNGKRYDQHIQLCQATLYGKIDDQRGAK